MNKDVVFSHSKLNTIIDDPYSYYLRYVKGFKLRDEPIAFMIGKAVHWGIENNTSNLDHYLEESKIKFDTYPDEFIMAEAMIEAYLNKKEAIYKEILSDSTLLVEEHELELNCKIPSVKYENHDFMGIIDLLLFTDKGIIIKDYKTSSNEPNWDEYLEQIYRYIMLVKQNFPDQPILKVGIINLRKTRIRQKKNETLEEFRNRMKFEYELKADEYITYHIYDTNDINELLYNKYIANLSLMCDSARMIIENELFFINYSKQRTIYGNSQFYDIVYDTPDNYILYNIKDNILLDGELVEERPCKPIDLIFDSKVLNSFDVYKSIRYEYKGDNLADYLAKNYIIDNELLRDYEATFKFLEIDSLHLS